MKKKLIILLSFLFIGIAVSMSSNYNQNIKLNNNIFIILPFILILSFPALKVLFPYLKNMGIGSIDFYPNVLKSILNWREKR